MSKRRKKRSRASAESRARVEPSGRVPANKWGVTERDLRRPQWFRIDEEGDQHLTHDTVPTALAKAGEQMEEVWLWCLHCERFFQAKDLKLDLFGNWQRCPFDDCGAAGFDVDILHWDCEKDVDPLWPQTEAALSFGQSTAWAPRSEPPN